MDGVITSSQNLTRLRNEVTALRTRQGFELTQLTELASTDFESGGIKATDSKDLIWVGQILET